MPSPTEVSREQIIAHIRAMLVHETHEQATLYFAPATAPDDPEWVQVYFRHARDPYPQWTNGARTRALDLLDAAEIAAWIDPRPGEQARYVIGEHPGRPHRPVEPTHPDQFGTRDYGANQ